ncbi:holin family protein [Tropicimonas marinistellae]|uniref:holin family protein n=1 Tax=Tropicimonas marinistellae TaxID=1739787 RepID=UPI00082CA3FA|nr:holin family protein [Tropicimonas marinistellae]
MGVMSGLLGALFGSGRNVVAETVEVFRENAEAGAAREALQAQAALAQFAAEFTQPRKSLFDQVIDGLNRIPRPAMALGTLALFVTAMVDPIWFAARMQGIALVPEPLWWLLGAIVGFYFGARHQAKGQEFQRSIAATLAQAAQVRDGIASLQALEVGAGGDRASLTVSATDTAGGDFAADVPWAIDRNAALAEWKDARG